MMISIYHDRRIGVVVEVVCVCYGGVHSANDAGCHGRRSTKDSSIYVNNHISEYRLPCMYVSCLGAVDGGDVGGEVREDLGRRDGFAVGLLEGDILAGFGEGDLVGGPRSVDHNIRKD